MRRFWPRCLAGSLGLLAACAVRTATAAEGLAFANVFITVGGDTTLVGAMLVDKFGTRTGWNRDKRVYEISSCTYYTEADAGIPSELGDAGASPGDSASSSPPEGHANTSRGVGEPTPRYQEFEVYRPSRARSRGELIDAGRCDLLVEPAETGMVSIGGSARRGSGQDCGRTEIRDVLRAGMRYRWRIEWKAVSDSCLVRFIRVRR